MRQREIRTGTIITFPLVYDLDAARASARRTPIKHHQNPAPAVINNQWFFSSSSSSLQSELMSSLDSVSHSLKALNEIPALPSLFCDTWCPRGASASIIQPAVGHVGRPEWVCHRSYATDLLIPFSWNSTGGVGVGWRMSYYKISNI